MTSSQNKHNISLSQNAAKKINALTAEGEDKGKSLRVSVTGGGCSGFQYKYDFVEKSDKSDITITKNGATILVDDVSADMLKDSIVDYEETLGFEHFVIKNPNSTSKCGCGNSFSI